MDLVLNNLQRLVCHKTQQTKPNHNNILVNLWTFQLTLVNMYLYVYIPYTFTYRLNFEDLIFGQNVGIDPNMDNNSISLKFNDNSQPKCSGWLIQFPVLVWIHLTIFATLPQCTDCILCRRVGPPPRPLKRSV